MPAGRKNTSRGHFWQYGVRGSARAIGERDALLYDHDKPVDLD